MYDYTKMTVRQLADAVEYHDKRYWELNAPEISDAQYDQLVEALRRADPDNPVLTRVNRVAVESSGKVRHTRPMLSLDKAYSLEELLEWGGKYARSTDELIQVEPKYDGISANFDGRVLATRGDGEEGEDISDKLPLIELETTGYTGRVDRPVRGEIIIRSDDFATLYSNIRKKDGGTYKNPRNAVAGIMGLKDIQEMLIQHAKLTLVDYDLISRKLPLDTLAARWEELKADFASLPYPMDGIVIKFADRAFRESLGSTAHHPRGEIAYKFTNVSCRTELIGVEWSFGKNCLTPVAQLKPVELSGITIKRASLHNAQNIIDMGLMIGDEVTVERAGDVIPYIASSTPGTTRKSPWIEVCPACGSQVVRMGPELTCANADCPEFALQRLLASLRNLGIERLGEPTLRKLIKDLGMPPKLAALFELTPVDLLKIDGFAAKSADNLIREIQKARNVDEVQLLASLNIPNVGANIAAVILEKFSIQQLREVDTGTLATIPGIGPERAGAIKETLAAKSDELDELLLALNVSRASVVSGDLPTVCFTGKMPEKRSFYQNLAAQRNMKAVDSVSSSLSLLVAADVNGSSSKLAAARKFGVRIVSLDEFLNSDAETANESASEVNEAWSRGELF